MQLIHLVVADVLVRHLTVDAQLRRVGQMNRGVDAVDFGGREFGSDSFVVVEERIVEIAQGWVVQVTSLGRRLRGSFVVDDGPLRRANWRTAIGGSRCE